MLRPGTHGIRFEQILRISHTPGGIKQAARRRRADSTQAILCRSALPVAGRDWRIEECGGHEPHPVPTIYCMTPERAISNGLASHSGAVLGEPYRREGTFLLDRLVK